MASQPYNTPACERAEETCANILAAFLAPIFIALIALSLATPDPVTSGHALAVEAVR
ncbi:hypothetical protein [Kozakia baliensis]|uniref:hypothetical protein n=1 Tax=Kozakia baliensis TaxID=153496 RepID=UPI0015658A1B|nr:hypothetical protein [Kozakia baliensis]